MVYVKQNWENLPSENTPISAARLAHMETQYDEAVAYINTTGANVKEFGAVGDGVSDDTQFIKQALLDSSTRGVPLVFPPGVYGVTEYLQLPHGSRIFGYGATLRRISSRSYFKVFVNGPLGGDTSGGYSGWGDISVYGLTVDLNSFEAPYKDSSGALVPTATMTAFDLGHGRNILLQDVSILNGQNGHYLQISGCENVELLRCKFLRQNWLNPSNTQYEAVQVESITQSSFPSFGPWDGTISRDIRLVGCIFDDLIRGVGTHSTSAGVNASNLLISNCSFRGIKDTALSLYGYEGVSVVDCRASDIGGFLAYLSQSERVSLRGVQGSQVSKAALHVESSNRVSLSDSFFQEAASSTSASYAGVRVNSSSGVSVSGVFLSGGYNYPYNETQSQGSKLVNFNFTPGSGPVNNGGVRSDSFSGFEFPGNAGVIFSGSVTSSGASASLSSDARAFSGVQVGVLYEGSLFTMRVPRSLLVSQGVTGRYRVPLGGPDFLVFSFPSFTSVKLESSAGNTTPSISVVTGG